MIDDPEICYAAALGRTLAAMRAELDEAAIKRIMVFVMSRYGIHPTGNDLIIHGWAPPVPPPEPFTPPRPAEVAPSVASSAGSAEPPARAVCPICGWATNTEKGVNLHMYHKHGTTLKEHARTLSLDLPELEP